MPAGKYALFVFEAPPVQLGVADAFDSWKADGKGNAKGEEIHCVRWVAIDNDGGLMAEASEQQPTAFAGKLLGQAALRKYFDHLRRDGPSSGGSAAGEATSKGLKRGREALSSPRKGKDGDKPKVLLSKAKKKKQARVSKLGILERTASTSEHAAGAPSPKKKGSKKQKKLKDQEQGKDGAVAAEAERAVEVNRSIESLKGEIKRATDSGEYGMIGGLAAQIQALTASLAPDAGVGPPQKSVAVNKNKVRAPVPLCL